MKTSLKIWKRPILITAIVIGSSLAALAGPPLICHAVKIGNAKSLPWVSNTWKLSGEENYDTTHLADDTLNLLTPEMPVIVRMETLRRAALYGQQNLAATKELLFKLRSRALDGGAQGKPDALALFDLGYFVECLKQANMTFRKVGADSWEPVYQPTVASNMDGLAWAEKALAMRGDDPEMEFAAALITSFARPNVSRESLERSSREHLRRAAAGAREGTLLAQNLEERYPEQGHSVAELRAHLRASQ